MTTVGLGLSSGRDGESYCPVIEVEGTHRPPSARPIGPDRADDVAMAEALWIEARPRPLVAC